MSVAVPKVAPDGTVSVGRVPHTDEDAASPDGIPSVFAESVKTTSAAGASGSPRTIFCVTAALPRTAKGHVRSVVSVSEAMKLNSGGAGRVMISLMTPSAGEVKL